VKICVVCVMRVQWYYKISEGPCGHFCVIALFNYMIDVLLYVVNSVISIVIRYCIYNCVFNAYLDENVGI